MFAPASGHSPSEYTTRLNSLAGDKTFKVHLDGYDMLDDFASSGEGAGPRQEVFYFTDMGEVSVVRHGISR